MATGLVPKLALASAAAVGLYIPTLGLPLPLNSCPPPLGVASAAPSAADEIACARDLRECLQSSARQTTYGARYVIADEVAKCMEAFRACTSEGASRSGNSRPPNSTKSESGTRASLPNRFGIDHGDGALSDCRVTGDSVTCTANWKTANDSYTAQFAGTLSGMTMTGTTTTDRSGTAPDDPGCSIQEHYSGPVTYIFSPDGGVAFTAGPNQRQSTFSGSCSGSNSGMTEVMKGTAKWSASQ